MRKKDLSIAFEMIARPNIGIQECVDRAYSNLDWPDEFKRFNQEFWLPVRQRSLLGPPKAYVIYQLAKAALPLSGDFIELGCYRGGLSFMLGLMIQRAGSDKKVYMCDRFDGGLPEPDRSVDKAYQAGTMACSISEIQSAIRELGLGSQCVTMPGLFAETLSQFDDDQRFALAHIDCDLYEGAKQSLEFIFPRLLPGAKVIMDDYYDESHGVMAAMNQFAESHEIVVHLSGWTQAYWIKDESPDETDAVKIDVGGNSIFLIADAVRECPGFLNILEEIVIDRKERVDRLERFIEFCRC